MDFREFVHAPRNPLKKPWKAKKEDLLRFWQQVEPNMPLQVQPISKIHRGTRYDSDGIRITGTASFIASIMSRLKDFLTYEGGRTELDVEYRQVASKTGIDKQIPKFVAYIHVIERPPEPPEQPEEAKPKEPEKPKF